MSGHDQDAPRPATTGRGCTPAHRSSAFGRPGSTKIRDRHLDRLAIVYIRQSSPQQVLEHQESRARQYALADYAVALGWPKDRVQVIDEDQGRSGKSSDHRLGFQRLLSEVTMGHAGMVLGLEMSRLSRSSRDWHHLVEVCAVFGTLLADQDGIYEANDTNDRLLLGLKGTMSEFELFTMRNRLDRGRLNKAERGELFLSVPFGYIKQPSGEVALDPDEQARSVVRLIFDKFDELGSLGGLFRYLVRNSIRLGIRARVGPRRGELEWRRPSRPTLHEMLHNPTYAGAYAFGRHRLELATNPPGPAPVRQRLTPMADWKVLLRNRLPAYITWDRYLANQERLRQNRSRPDSPGPARDGAALLTGLLECGACGGSMHASYRAKHKAYYGCVRHNQVGIAQTCPGLSAAAVDDLVARQVLRALEPAALELSLKAVRDVEEERGRLHRLWKQRLERARYEAGRAERQYHAVEPENRLVARTLEQRWEEALRQEREIAEEYDRFLSEQPIELSGAERERILALSRDIPELWRAPGTTASDRKKIVRLLVERVVVAPKKGSEYVDVAIHWRGGFSSRHEVVRPVRLYEDLRDHDRLMDRIERWRREGRRSSQIAEDLNREGFRTPKGRGAFTALGVRKLLSRRGLSGKRACASELARHEWWLCDLARDLAVPAKKLRAWAARGWVRGRKTPDHGLWVVWADGREKRRLARLDGGSKLGEAARPSSRY